MLHLNTKSAFTLVELAIVLVILGLLIGGVLGGKSLIRAAQIRSTIAQVDNIKVAARTFREKYFYYPGDIPTADAIRLGLSRYPYYNTAGNGDGDLEFGANGEPQLFFVHLAEKGFLAGSFSAFDLNGDVSGAQIANYIMPARLSGNFYFNIWSGGPNPTHPNATTLGVNGKNYIGLSSTTRYCHSNPCGDWGGRNTMATIDAFAFDMKVDDGKPQSGDVQAFYWADQAYGEWAGSEYSGRGTHTFGSPLPSTAANPASSVNCYDNGNSAGVAQSYTVSMDNNTCAISFQF